MRCFCSEDNVSGDEVKPGPFVFCSVFQSSPEVSSRAILSEQKTALSKTERKSQVAEIKYLGS
jgi:hypothetical protein